MKKSRKDNSFIKQPIYPGGMEAMTKFIQSELMYPPAALKNKIQGVVKLRYSVDYKGKVVEAKVVKKLGYGCDEEAQRIVGLFQFKVPKNKVSKVLFHKTINIHFHYNEKKKPKDQSVNYQYTSKPKEKTDSAKESYNYQIEW